MAIISMTRLLTVASLAPAALGVFVGDHHHKAKPQEHATHFAPGGACAEYSSMPDNVLVETNPSTQSRSVEKEGHTVKYAVVSDAHSMMFWDKMYSSWENESFAVFKRFAPNKVVLDIGAWVGPMSLWLAHDAEKVVSLEPTKTAFGQFCANLAVNPEVAGKIAPVNMAMGDVDSKVEISNDGGSGDQIFKEHRSNTINVPEISINKLVQQHPELEHTGFVKIDTEGFERIIVPGMAEFFKEKKPVAYVSLHPTINTAEQVQATVDKLKETFPYLYEVDMKTPFNTARSNYTYGDHGGSDVVCSFTKL